MLEKKKYADGTEAIGISPLPEQSPREQSLDDAMRCLDDMEALFGGCNGPMIRLRNFLSKLTEDRDEARIDGKASPASVPAPIEHEPLRADESISEQVNHYHYAMGWNACRDAMLAAAPTPPVSKDRWQPIETAPKDKFVLLAGPSGYTTIEIVYATGRMCSDYHVGRWIDHANDDLTDWGFEPTHWMPLPKAPTMQEDKP